MKVLIIDSDKKSRTLLEKTLKETNLVSGIFAVDKAEHALSAAIENEIDLVFVDFITPGMNGIGFLNDLAYSRPHLVIISSHEKVAKEAYDLQALDFLLKPFKSSRLMKTLAKAINMDEGRQSRIHNSENLFIKHDGNLKKIQPKDIYLLEAAADYVKIYTNEKTYTIYSTFKKAMETLSGRDFMRIHRSFIIRIDRITAVEDNTVKVDNHLVPVSNTYKAALMDRLKVL